MLEVTCPNGHRLKAKAEHAGKRIKCPKCGEATRLPESNDPGLQEYSLEIIPDELPETGYDDPYGDEYGYSYDASDGESWNAPDESARALPPRRKSTIAAKGKKTASPAADSAASTSQLVPGISRNQYVVFGSIAAAGVVLISSFVGWFLSGGQEPAAAVVVPMPGSGAGAVDANSGSQPPSGTTDFPQAPLPAPTTQNAATDAKVHPAVPASPDPSQSVASADVDATATPKESRSGSTAHPELTAATNETKSDEVPWNLRVPRTHLLAIDQRFILEFKREVQDLEFAHTKEGQPAPGNAKSNWTSVSSELAKPIAQGEQLRLAAAILNVQQSVILLDERSFRTLRNKPVPFTIIIGDERIQVTEIDDYTSSLKVTRESPITHSVSEPVLVAEAGQDTSVSNNGIPYLRDLTNMHWFPTAEHAGKGVIHVRWYDYRTNKIVGYQWDVLVGDSAAIVKLQKELDGPEDDGLAPLPFPVWEPVSSPSPDQRSVVSSSDAETRKSNVAAAKAMAGIRAAGNGVQVRFREGQNGKTTIDIQSLDGDKQAEISVVPGAGLPIPQLTNMSWSAEMWSTKKTDLQRSGEIISVPEEKVRIRVHRFSGLHSPIDPDENFPLHPFRFRTAASLQHPVLYSLNSDGLLCRTNLQSLQIEASVRIPLECMDVCLCSEGVVLLAKIPRTLDYLKQPSPEWKSVEPAKSSEKVLQAHIMFLLDQDSLKIKNAFSWCGNCLAGRETDSVIYVGNVSHVCAIDMKHGTINGCASALDAPALPQNPDNRFAATPEPIPPLGSLYLAHHSSLLLGTPMNDLAFRSARFGIRRFDVSAGSIRQIEPIVEEIVKDPICSISDDGELIGLRAKEDRSVHLFSANVTGQMTHRMGNYSADFPCALDSDTKSCLCVSRPSTTSAGKTLLVLQQGRRLFPVEIGQDRIIDLQPIGRGRFLVTTLKESCLVEVVTKSDFWPFEPHVLTQIPSQRSEFQSEVLKVPEPSGSNPQDVPPGVIVSGEFTARAPDGSAYIDLRRSQSDDPQEYTTVISRYDASKHTRTHQFIHTSGTSIVPTFMMTSDGVLFDTLEKNNRYATYLLRNDDLSVVSKVDGAFAFPISGHCSHGHFAALNNGGIVVYEGASGKVIARAGLLDLKKQFQLQDISIEGVLATENPNRFIVGDWNQVAEFELSGNRLLRVSEIKKEKQTFDRQKASLSSSAK